MGDDKVLDSSPSPLPLSSPQHLLLEKTISKELLLRYSLLRLLPAQVATAIATVTSPSSTELSTTPKIKLIVQPALLHENNLSVTVRGEHLTDSDVASINNLVLQSCDLCNFKILKSKVTRERDSMANYYKNIHDTSLIGRLDVTYTVRPLKFTENRIISRLLISVLVFILVMAILAVIYLTMGAFKILTRDFM